MKKQYWRMGEGDKDVKEIKERKKYYIGHHLL
jgi:hypothetical protein